MRWRVLSVQGKEWMDRWFKLIRSRWGCRSRRRASGRDCLSRTRRDHRVMFWIFLTLVSNCLQAQSRGLTKRLKKTGKGCEAQAKIKPGRRYRERDAMTNIFPAWGTARKGRTKRAAIADVRACIKQLAKLLGAWDASFGVVASLVHVR